MRFFTPTDEALKQIQDIANARMTVHAEMFQWKNFSFTLNFYCLEVNAIGEIHYAYYKKEDEAFGICSELFNYIDDGWASISLIE